MAWGVASREVPPTSNREAEDYLQLFLELETVSLQPQ